MRKVYVFKFIASFDQYQPLRQGLGCEVGSKQTELVARQRRQQFVVQRTAKIFRMHCDILPDRSGRFRKGMGRRSESTSRAVSTYVKEKSGWLFNPMRGLWTGKIQT